MSSQAKLYVSVLVALGLAVVVSSLDLDPQLEPVRFLCYFALAVLAALIKAGRTVAAASVSFSFVFILIGIIDLSLQQTLVIAITTVLIENLWRTRTKPRAVQVVFQVATTALGVFCATKTFRSEFLIEHGCNLPVRLLFSTTAFFIITTFPNSAVLSLNAGIRLLGIWKEQYFWAYPYYLVGALLAFSFRVTSLGVGWPTALLTLPFAALLHRTYSLYLGRLEDERVHAEELASIHLRTIEALALAIEAKDDTTHEHLRRVQVYAIEIGKDLKLSELDLEALHAAAILHDIGKLAVPEHIISKPGKLTPEEFEKMKIHPVVGAEILEQVRFPYPVVPIVRAHHEKWNGTGYPMGLRGTDIPIGARILSAVDALDALASDRQYRRALPLSEAMAKIELESGSSFDPTVVKILKRRHVELEKRAKQSNFEGVRLSTNIKILRGAAPAAGFETARPALFQRDEAKTVDHLDSLADGRRDVQRLFDFGYSAENALQMDEILALLAVRLKRVIPYDSCAVYVVNEDHLEPAYVCGDNYKLFSSLRIPMGQGLSGWVAENRKPILNGNPSVEPGYLNDPSVFSTLRSAVSVPLEVGPDILGVLTLYHEGRDAFSKDHLKMANVIAPKLALTISQTSHELSSPHPSPNYDPVTGIAQGRLFFSSLEEELQRCRRLNTSLAVLVCSVDGLTTLLQRYGRIQGDKFLRSLAGSLKEGTRDFDFVARLGTNEFALILPGMKPDAVEAKAEKLMHLVSVESGEPVALVTGAAFFPQDGNDAQQLVAEADRRMFENRQDRHMAGLAESTSRASWIQ